MRSQTLPTRKVVDQNCCMGKKAALAWALVLVAWQALVLAAAAGAAVAAAAGAAPFGCSSDAGLALLLLLWLLALLVRPALGAPAHPCRLVVLVGLARLLPCACASPALRGAGKVVCPNFDVPTGANVLSISSRAVGAKVAFGCQSPRMLVGPATADCLANGEWSVFPQCVRSIERCADIRCELRRDLHVAVLYDTDSSRQHHHHCQFHEGSTDPKDCTCWCW